MRVDFIFILVTLGTIVCTTYASHDQAITSSDVQQESDDVCKSLQEDLDLHCMIAISQDANNIMHSVGQSVGRFMSAIFGQIQKGKKLGRKSFGSKKIKLGGVKVGRKRGRNFGRGLRRGGRRLRQRLRGGGRRFRQILRGGRKRFG